MRMFCTSGPVDKKTCYYVERPDITEEALNHIERWEYFNIIAPAHSGKTTFLRMLEEKIKDKYLPMYVSFKDYKNIENSEDFVNKFFESIEINNKLKRLRDIENYFYELHEEQKKDIILMIDDYNELDNKEVLNDLLHIIRAMFHKKELYGLRSVIISGTEYIPIFPDDPASPYNIAYEMEFPYFTKEQVYDLLSQHEKETGQIFEEKVKELIWHNAAGQPGLTNGLANDLVVKKAFGEKIITVKHFEKTLEDYMRVYIDKNISNIINKAKKEKELIMKILFEPEKIEFNIYDENIQYLYLNGVIDNCDGKCCVKVPLYYKALYTRFRPKVNGEKSEMKTLNESVKTYLRKDGSLDLNKLLERYTRYIKNRGAIMFKGRNYYEGVYQYNLDQFLSLYVEAAEGKVYPETQIGGGRIDLLINLNNKEYLIEIKSNIDEDQYEKSKKQLVEYLKRSGLKEGWLVIYSEAIEDFKHEIEEIDGVKINVWFIKTNFESPSKVN